ncbi:MAG: M15 family metallopeptidase [Beijerinckiaceae bacterium]
MPIIAARQEWPLQNSAAMNAFYGNPDANHDGRADSAWAARHLVRIKPPYPMQWSWGGAVASLTVNRRCAPSLQRILEAIAQHYGSQAAIEKARMHLCGGAFHFRLKRGGHTLSIHSWGAAIDLDPERNGFGRRYSENRGMMPMAVVDIFAREGWIWGGRWSKADAMHFQAARLNKLPPAPSRSSAAPAAAAKKYASSAGRAVEKYARRDAALGSLIHTTFQTPPAERKLP